MLEGKSIGRSDHMTTWAYVIGIAIIILCIVEWIREVVTFKVTHYPITSSKLKGLKKEQKIIFLSDLHNNRYGKGNERLIKAIEEEQPDVILVGGDMLVGVAGISTEVARTFVTALTKIAPVFCANGNHEQRMKEYPDIYGDTYDEYKKALLECGVTFLENSSIDMKWDDCDVRITGLEIPPECYAKFRPTFLKVEEVKERIGEIEQETFQILLAHNPKYMETYKEWGADVILSGHYHGGMVRIPGLGGMITPQGKLFPTYSGEYTKEGERSIIVSRGIGMHTIRLRFLNSAEVIVLEFQPTK